MAGPKPAILMSWVIISMAIRAFCWASEICSLARTALPVIVSAAMPANTITEVTAVATMISTNVNPCSYSLSWDLISCVRPFPCRLLTLARSSCSIELLWSLVPRPQTPR